MLKLRLKKFGRKKKPCYRIILIDSRKKRDGRAIEELGFYNPLNKNIQINVEQIRKRMRDGAIFTKTVGWLVEKHITK